MKSLALRLTLVVLFVAAAGAAAYFSWMAHAVARQDAGAAGAFDESAVGAERDVLELRSAQQGYVAAGQGDPFWASKVDAVVVRLRDTLNALRTQSTAPRAQQALDAASSALQDFEQMDHRARDYSRSGQKLLASDLIFANGLELTTATAAAVEEARLAERQARVANAAEHDRRAMIATAGALAAGLFVIALLVPRGEDAAALPEPAARITPRVEAARQSSPRAAGESVEEGWSAARVVPRTKPAQRPAAAASSARAGGQSAAPIAPPVATSAAVSTARTSIDLSGVAALCSDLARVTDTQALPAILERAAAVLDAPGIVLWIADPDGRELSPIVTYGYPKQLVSRLGTILRDAENATASAFRTSLLQTVKADAVSNGAIAAPLNTPAGCVGVMAAEVRHAAESDPARLAIAAIVAAQLATLVGPPSARANARVEAAGA